MFLTNKRLGKSSPSKLRDKYWSTRISNMVFIVTLVSNKKPLTNVKRRSIIDVAKVLDSPLKPVSEKKKQLLIGKLKMNYVRNTELVKNTCVIDL